MFQNPCFDAHEKAVHVFHEDSGLRAIISLHSTALGPAAGGCRLWPYESDAAALSDALRLSRGMSYKNAMAGLKMGGGKAVILGPLDPDKRVAAFEALGVAVDALNGSYVTAEDVGVSVQDMQIVATRTRFVSGLPPKDGIGGDPSPYTARGVRLGIEAAAEFALGRTSLEGLRVAIQGLGAVGSHLAGELFERGAKLVVADIDPEKVERVCDRFGATPAPVETVLLQDVDIVAPCALGGAITDTVADAISARIVAGGANNQIASASAGETLLKRGITYAPDYLINAGGIIMVASEYVGETDIQVVEDAIAEIRPRTLDLLSRARIQARPAGEVADRMAQEIIARAHAAKTS